MQTNFILLLCILYTISIEAQITITNATFPVVGDTLRYAIAFNQDPPNFYTPPGGNQLWDFSGLVPNETFETVYQAASVGQYAASFPGADLVVISPTGESYYNVTSTDLELLGYMHTKLFDIDFTWIYHNNPPFKERHAPLNFFDIAQQANGQLEGMDIDELPAGFKNSIKNVIPTVDSIRLRTAKNTIDVIDAWGTLTIPGPAPQPQYEVLRQKTTEYLERRIDAKVPPIGWLDVTDLFIQNNLGGSTNYLGVDTTVFLKFLNDLSKEEIAVIMMNNEQNAALSVRVKNNETLSSAGHVPFLNEATIRAYPNPASDHVRFVCNNLPAANYLIRLFDNTGKAILANSYALAPNQPIQVELKDLEQGVYIYRLEDQNGRVVASNNLVILSK